MKEIIKEIIVFDMDGVLVDSVERSLAALCGIITRHDLDLDHNLIVKNWGHSFENFLIPLLAGTGNWPEYKKLLVLNDANDYFEHAIFKEPNNLEEKLIALKELGYDLGIITNRSLRMLEKALSDLDIKSDIFSHQHSVDSGIRKPDSKVFESLLERYQASKITFVGDSLICDFPAAYNCQPKVNFVGITSVIHSRDDFVLAGVPEEKIFNSVIDFIDKIIINNLVPEFK